MTLWIIPESDREGGGSLTDLAPTCYTQDRLQQIKTSPLWLWSLPGDLRATPLFLRGVSY